MKVRGTLFRRGNRWWWKVKVPSELGHLPQYQGQEGKVKQNAASLSLETSDKTTAQVRATILAAEWTARFTEELRGHPVPLLKALDTPITPEIAEAIAHGVYRKTLAQDDFFRETPDGMKLLDVLHSAALSSPSFQRLLIPSKRKTTAPQSSPLMGLTQGAVMGLKGINSQLDKDTAQALISGKLVAVQALADESALKLGLTVDWHTPGGMKTLRRCLETYRKAAQERTQRDRGDVVQTPTLKTLPVKEAPPKIHTLREVFEKWKVGSTSPSAGTIRKKEYAVRLYEEFTGHAPIQSLTHEQGADFAAWLLTKVNAQKTAKDRLDEVKSLLTLATRGGGLGWLQENPWTAHGVKVKQKSIRRPWSSKALVTLFDSPLFKAYELPTIKGAGGAAAYWVPLLGLYTGARLSELCQLRICDIEKMEAGLAIHITADSADEEEGTAETILKHEVSIRRIPVHPALLALGFEDYWNETKNNGNTALFPDIIRKDGQGAGDRFTRWFRTYRAARGVKTRWVDFHAFRHTAKTRLTDARVPDSMADHITGHTTAGRGSAGVYKHFEDTLSSLVKLQYPELKLERVYWPKGFPRENPSAL